MKVMMLYHLRDGDEERLAINHKRWYTREVCFISLAS